MDDDKPIDIILTPIRTGTACPKEALLSLEPNSILVHTPGGFKKGGSWPSLKAPQCRLSDFNRTGRVNPTDQMGIMLPL